MRTIVAVTTTLRVGADYFPQTIAQLEQAGARELPVLEKLVYSDGPLIHRPPGWEIEESSRPLGSLSAFVKICWKAYSQGADLLAFEDDVVLCRNAVPAMIEYEVPEDVAFVSFFDNVTPEGAPPGLRTTKFMDLDFWGAQAVKVPFRSLKYLLFPQQEVARQELRDGRQHGRDMFMQFAFMNSPFKQWGTLLPHFVQHVGDISVVNSSRALRAAAQGAKRDSKNWPGPEFDAFEAVRG